MIKATIFRNNADELVGFEISGHAGFAERGQDIVCAAVSFLATTVVNSLEEHFLLNPITTLKKQRASTLLSTVGNIRY